MKRSASTGGEVLVMPVNILLNTFIIEKSAYLLILCSDLFQYMWFTKTTLFGSSHVYVDTGFKGS
jgi:hypothetical protein